MNILYNLGILAVGFRSLFDIFPRLLYFIVFYKESAIVEYHCARLQLFRSEHAPDLQDLPLCGELAAPGPFLSAHLQLHVDADTVHPAHTHRWHRLRQYLVQAEQTAQATQEPPQQVDDETERRARLVRFVRNYAQRC